MGLLELALGLVFIGDNDSVVCVPFHYAARK